MSADGVRAKTGVSGIRRFARRALVAVGGAVAGTAVAWALTTSSAQAAEDVPQADLVSKVAHSDVFSVEPAKKFVDNVDETLRAEQQKARAAIPAGEVQDVVGKVADLVQPRLRAIVPAEEILGSGSVAQPTPTAPIVEQAPVAEPVVAAPHVTGNYSGVQWTNLLDSHHAVVSDEQRPSLPADPSRKLPVPAHIPVHCGCASDGSGSAGGSNSAAQAASGSAHDIAVARAMQPTTDEVSVTPGKQPGTTPD